MPRSGVTKVDFYPDEEVQKILKTLPPNTRSTTLNDLIKAYLSPDFEEREHAEANLEEVLKRRNKTSKSKYAGSWADTTNRLITVFGFMCRDHNISLTKESIRYGTIKFSQALRQFQIDPEQDNLMQDFLVQSAFFKTVGEVRYWQSKLAFHLEEGELYIFADKWKSGHPPLHDDRMVVYELDTITADQAIKDFVYAAKMHYLDEGQPFVCRWRENGEIKERQLMA